MSLYDFRDGFYATGPRTCSEEANTVIRAYEYDIIDVNAVLQGRP